MAGWVGTVEVAPNGAAFAASRLAERHAIRKLVEGIQRSVAIRSEVPVEQLPAHTLDLFRRPRRRHEPEGTP